MKPLTYLDLPPEIPTLHIVPYLDSASESVYNYVLGKGPIRCLSRGPLIEACSYPLPFLLFFLDRKQVDTRSLCQCAAEAGNLPALQLAKDRDYPANDNVFRSAVASGKVEILDYLSSIGFTKDRVAPSYECYVIAGKLGHERVILWLKEKGFSGESGAYCGAAMVGNVPLFKSLLRCKVVCKVDKVLPAVCQASGTEILELLLRTNPQVLSPTMYCVAWKAKNWAVCTLLAERGIQLPRPKPPYRSFFQVVPGGHTPPLALIKLLHAQRLIDLRTFPTSKSDNNAYTRYPVGKFHVMIHRPGKARLSNDLLTLIAHAIEQTRTDLLEWLDHELKFDRTDPVFCNNAASLNLPMLKWFHERGFVCDEFIYHAASYGCCDTGTSVLQWIKENGHPVNPGHLLSTAIVAFSLNMEVIQRASDFCGISYFSDVISWIREQGSPWPEDLFANFLTTERRPSPIFLEYLALLLSAGCPVVIPDGLTSLDLKHEQIYRPWLESMIQGNTRANQVEGLKQLLELYPVSSQLDENAVGFFDYHPS